MWRLAVAVLYQTRKCSSRSNLYVARLIKIKER